MSGATAHTAAATCTVLCWIGARTGAVAHAPSAAIAIPHPELVTALR
jgi:hypothetical protein